VAVLAEHYLGRRVEITLLLFLMDFNLISFDVNDQGHVNWYTEQEDIRDPLHPLGLHGLTQRLTGFLEHIVNDGENGKVLHQNFNY